MAVCHFTDNQRKNLLAFLDRIPIKGLIEIQAINEILLILQAIPETEEKKFQ